eukprot:6211722-Pleurochrysis_carterae.AAC.1
MLHPCALVYAALVAGVAARSAVLSTQPAQSQISLVRHASGANARLRCLRGGASEPSDALLQATFACNRLYASVMAEAAAEVVMLRKAAATGEDARDFGAKVDTLLSDAAEKFAAGTPAGNEEVAELYAAKAEELQTALLVAVEPIFVRVLGTLKEAALEQFKKDIVGELDVTEAMSKAENMFARDAKGAVPSKSNWNFKAERQSLQGVMQLDSATSRRHANHASCGIADPVCSACAQAVQVQAKKAKSAKDAAQQQLSTAMQYLNIQSQQMQAMQAQFAGGQGGKWNFGAAYRPPDTNINLSGSYQQGRANIQVSMVPDEGAALLGANGFTQGVGPANLGLSVFVHV